ncbi:MAG: hypothetical protein MUO23_07415 [Anaerolineales bacterium]|nr:hypothetical protein [Anaerolineales bacterium]
MSSRTWVRALLFLLLLCFGFGLLSVVLQDRSDPSPGNPSATTPAGPPASTSTPSAASTAILILGVDNLDQESPRLLATWVAAHDPEQDQLLLYGIPTSASAPTGDGRPLASLFTWSRTAGVGDDFMQALSALVPLTYQATVVMDEAAFAAAVDALGGADLGGTHLQGAQLLAFLRLLQTKPEALLAAQAEVLLALRPGLQDLGAAPDISDLEALHPDHVHLTLEPQQLAALVAPMLPFEAASIRVGTLLDQPEF